MQFIVDGTKLFGLVSKNTTTPPCSWGIPNSEKKSTAVSAISMGPGARILGAVGFHGGPHDLELKLPDPLQHPQVLPLVQVSPVKGRLASGGDSESAPEMRRFCLFFRRFRALMLTQDLSRTRPDIRGVFPPKVV